MIEEKGRRAVSDEDLAWFDSAKEELSKAMPRFSPEELAAFNTLKNLPEEIVDSYGDWTINDLALLWPVIRTELYAKGYLDERDDEDQSDS
jgi:hypothetical protein